MSEAYHTTDKKYSRSQIVVWCNTCKDTAFVMLEDKKLTKRCCRCGKDIG